MKIEGKEKFGNFLADQVWKLMEEMYIQCNINCKSKIDIIFLINLKKMVICMTILGSINERIDPTFARCRRFGWRGQCNNLSLCKQTKK